MLQQLQQLQRAGAVQRGPCARWGEARSHHQPSSVGRSPLVARPRPMQQQLFSAATSADTTSRLSREDLTYLEQAATLADSSAGLTQPHPNAACIIVGPDGKLVASAYQRAQGTESCEAQAAAAAQEAARGGVAYLNLESGDCHGDSAAVKALLGSQVARVVVGLRHPLAHARGQAIKALRQAGVSVDVLGEAAGSLNEFSDSEHSALSACLRVNEALMHRAVLRRPMSILKYAMTLDGKIATQMGHSAWVTSPPARALVFEQRARSDAVIVGGNTVRRDNPRLTTRKEGGHTPARVVMSRTLDLPQDAALWDVSVAPTIVMTQRGAKQQFQAMLVSRGVEVVEFDFLTPENVAEYCYDRGFLQCFWECGGVLSAPCISSNVIHKVMAFVAPKIIGGERAPSPVGELGFVEMTQAVILENIQWSQVGPDLMIQGFLPTSGGALSLESSINRSSATSTPLTLPAKPPPSPSPSPPSPSPSSSPKPLTRSAPSSGSRSRASPPTSPTSSRKALFFYKAWEQWGAFSNFSPHPIALPHGSGGEQRRWSSLEHYYQSSKFSPASEEGRALIEEIAAMPSPEEAARLGRRMERSRPELMRSDWAEAKLDVMLTGLQAKFSAHDGPRALLLSTGSFELVESSPHDFFWGQGYDGSGRNNLGRLLMYLRGELQAAAGGGAGAAAGGGSSSGSGSGSRM